MNKYHHPRVQHPSERTRAGYVSSVCLYHRSAVPVRQGEKISSLSPQSANQSILSSMAVIYGQSRPNLPSSSSNRTLTHLIFTSGSSKTSSLPKRYVRLGILSLPEVDSSNKCNGNDEVGSGIGNSGGVPIGGVLDCGARINVNGAADLIRTIDALVRGSIIGGGGGSGVNIARNTSSAGGRYSGYSGP
nr:hypothetical protein [Tanacetum cinerariifolium]